ncbi:MAG: OmpH family outer membrane protein [Phycisphaerae bacterium]|nr:OmpH family outer membrane protein [Phycisphaerae bacterium]
MRATERFVVYGMIATLLVAVLSMQRPAVFASPSLPLLDELGPTDALVLKGSKGDLKVRNGDGRVAWGDRPTDRALSLAFVHADRVMNSFIAGSRVEDERKSLDERHEVRRKELRQKHEDFMKEFGKVEPGHPEFERAREAYGELRKVMETWGEEMRKEYEDLLKEQLDGAWKEILAAVDVVAERRGVDVVLRFIPATHEFEAEDPEGGVHQLFARTVLRMPESLDLTSDVMKELNLAED